MKGAGEGRGGGSIGNGAIWRVEGNGRRGAGGWLGGGGEAGGVAGVSTSARGMAVTSENECESSA